MMNAHWAERRRVTETTKGIVYGTLLHQFGAKKVGRMKKVRVTIEAHFQRNNIRDPDDLFIKPVLDTIVRYGILQDDHGDVIHPLIIYTKRNQKEDKVIVIIEEVK